MDTVEHSSSMMQNNIMSINLTTPKDDSRVSPMSDWTIRYKCTKSVLESQSPPVIPILKMRKSSYDRSSRYCHPDENTGRASNYSLFLGEEFSYDERVEYTIPEALCVPNLNDGALSHQGPSYHPNCTLKPRLRRRQVPSGCHTSGFRE